MTEPLPRRRRLHRRRVLLGAVVAVVLAVVGLALTVRPWQETGSLQRLAQPSEEDIQTGLTLYPPGTRPRAPDASGRTMDGGNLSLRELRGHIVVVNVWGSWCGPCRKEAPDLVRLARETQNKGVRFVGIDTRDNPTAARAFVRSFRITYPSIDDQSGTVLLQFAGVIPISAVPSTLAIDPHGRIAARVIGKTTYATLRGLLDDLLAEQNPDQQATPGASRRNQP